MDIFKKIVIAAAFATLELYSFTGFVFATPAITGVTAQQRFPWNGKVDIAYTVTDIASAAKEQGLTTSLKVTAIDRETGTSYMATSLSGNTMLTDGAHSVVWDMGAQGLTFVSTDVVFSVSCEATPALYCVIDLLSGAEAASYPVTYLASPPSDGFNEDSYKTSKLVLRRIEAGTFVMGRDQTDESHRVTLTKPFFIGLFEVTQKQWLLVTGGNPSYFSGDKRPVEMVNYNMIRGSLNGSQWPVSNAVDAGSFIGKLRARTSLDFDLPTEAQWEYACRAGTTTTYNYGNVANENYMWCTDNSSSQTHEVGSKLPNLWGLYDMHGNVNEWCIDWYETLAYGIDPKGSTYSSEERRVLRGGGWYDVASNCASSIRDRNYPAHADNYYPYGYGFRLAWPLAATSQATTISGSSASISIPPQSNIFFDLQGGTGGSASATATYGAAMPTIAIPTRTGYSFCGYYTAANGGGEQYYSADGTSATVRTGTSDMTLYAKWWRPNAPTITPAGGIVASWPLSVAILCATEGATIHYTTDGSEPTVESAVYRRFRISERTTVKAVAIKDGLASEVAVAEYAAGQCADPVITPADGMSFEHAGQNVSIAWSGEDGVLRYTTDGSDPTTNSPVYGGTFTIDDSTVVKAKAFGDQFFDSAIVTANITRIWANVATPVVNAASSFTGTETKVSLSCATEGSRIYYTLDGNDPNSHSTRYAGPFYVTDSCTVKAYATCFDYLDSAVATQSIEKVWGVGDTLGAPDHTFATGGNLPFVRVTDNTAPLGESMKSGAITDSQQSTLSTTVMGPGTISFQWKTSCEDSDGYYDWDHAEFWVDGTRIAQLDGEAAWQTVTQAISGTGPHTLLWKYIKDNVASEGEDCCWVADYRWTSAYTATQTTEVPVPYAWLRGSFPHTPDEYDAYESAAKATAANGVNKVWECYVAGLVPTNATDVFRAVISMVNGNPVIGWTPDLNEGGTKQERVYTVEGRSSLAEGDWEELRIENGELRIGNCRFFRVKVALQ
jgi:formylglycine-generating enzyme required for sulfatase activity